MGALNVRMDAYNFLQRKDVIDTNTLLSFAKKIGYKGPDNRFDVYLFLTNYCDESFTFEKVYASMEDLNPNKDPFASITIPEEKQVCAKCGSVINVFGMDYWLSRIYNHDGKLCPDCFLKELQCRSLTEEEIKTLSEELYDKWYVHTTVPSYVNGLSGIFTAEQAAVIEQAVKNMKEQADKAEEEATVKKYQQRVFQYMQEAGVDAQTTVGIEDLKKVLAIMLRNIDEYVTQTIRDHRPLSEIRFG